MLKKMIQKLCIFIVSSAILAPAFAAATSQVESQPQVVEKALKFEQKGILRQKGHGQLYLEVSKDYVKELLPLIQTTDKLMAPWFVQSRHGIGAHIDVIHESEMAAKNKMKIKEVGKTFTFTVKDVRTVQLPGCKSGKKLWLLTVDAPELQKLRESYGLAPKFKDREFHIVLGSNQLAGKFHHWRHKGKQAKKEEQSK